ncbi:MAG TPA: GntR family transcriptional regulator [Sphingomicrobium sp.]|nr:GntR family transcriptional regulator [Sphingomicrobium sp.]
MKKAKEPRAVKTPHYGPFPKYLQIRDVIVRWLSAQKVGERLPTEMALSDKFGVSRETIRKSLKRLEQSGIIRRRPRAGTFLVRLPAKSPDHRLTGPIEEFKDLGTTTVAKLISQGPVRAPADVASAFGVVQGELVYEFKRVRLVSGRPLLLLDAYFPLSIGRKIARKDFHGELIVPTLREIVPSNLREEYQQIDAIQAKGSLARQLRLKPGLPVLLVKRLFLDAAGNPVVFFRENFRADQYFYTIKLSQS